MYACGPRMETLITHSEHDDLKITVWFPNNFMKINDDTCHLMIFGVKVDHEITIKIGEDCVKESTEENILGITFDQSLSFKGHVKTLCRKAGQKLHARSASRSNTKVLQAVFHQQEGHRHLRSSSCRHEDSFHNKQITNDINSLKNGKSLGVNEII